MKFMLWQIQFKQFDVRMAPHFTWLKYRKITNINIVETKQGQMQLTKISNILLQITIR